MLQLANRSQFSSPTSSMATIPNSTPPWLDVHWLLHANLIHTYLCHQ
jgi:hypothetical protein